MLRSKRNSTDRGVSTPLVDLFVSRTGKAGRSPQSIIEDLVERLRQQTDSASARSLDRYLELRNVIERHCDSEIGCDGYIEPVGGNFAEGFRLVINDQAPKIRQRFTIAHEICHTFFYEIVPELKFVPHATDDREEALCNHGAAALLMPTHDVVAQVQDKDVSLGTLEELSERYEVSLEAAFLRLRGLKLWNCEMSVWYRMTSGEFIVKKLYGWLKADWRWVDNSIPNRAWSQKSSNPIAGKSFVYFERSDKLSAASNVFYQIKRRGDSLVSLWATKQLGGTRKARVDVSQRRLYGK